ncbi:MAG TPA: glycoside hydrolase family 43 protein, partial [Polyangiaceae bacterium]
MKRTFQPWALVAALVTLPLLGCSSAGAPEGDASDGGAGEAAAAPTDAAGSDSTVPIGAADAASAPDASSLEAGADAMVDATPPADASAPGDDGAPPDAAEVDAAVTCSTRISYGSAWIAPANHPNPYDVVSGSVTWDGTCTDDGSNSYATLSNGWKPYFTGNGACILAFDQTGSCGNTPAACTTRITYGPGWLAPANHSASYDDVTGRVFSDGACKASGSNSQATLSNGWTPTFSGASSCRLSFRYEQCGGLYKNAVVPGGCADPGVLRDGNSYVLTCTSGDAADAYPIYTSPDLATWTPAGHVFPSGHWPSWAKKDFWAPEIHKVGGKYVVYFSARGADNMLAIGAASAPSALGPFTDIGAPLVHDASMGLIDASEINAPQGPYVLWKEDGNALGKPTPIHAQPLAADGLSLTGSPSTLITNDQSWEGAVTEGPFMVENAGTFYLFYSGNSYANATYAVGVARASSPTGPFTKASGPILTTNDAWVGPGHCSVVDTPAGDTAIVYHAWVPGCVNASGCGRLG